MNSEFPFLVYRSAEEDVSVNAVIRDETIWPTQKAMAELFGCSTDNISLHLKNIYADQELRENATSEEFSAVQTEGTRQVTRRIFQEICKTGQGKLARSSDCQKGIITMKALSHL